MAATVLGERLQLFPELTQTWFEHEAITKMQASPKSAPTVPTAQPTEGPADRRRWLVRLALVVATVAFSATYVTRAPLLSGVAYLLTVDTVAAPADYIVPLGGGAETRPFEAAALYKKRIAPRVLIFEYATNDVIRMGLASSGTELYRRILEIEGVPDSAIQVIPGVVSDTWGEALAVRHVLPPGHPVRLVVVTSPEHTRRALWAFRKVFADTPVDIRMAPARNLRFNETNWWRHDEGVLTYMHEYLKLPYYWARYTF